MYIVCIYVYLYVYVYLRSNNIGLSYYWGMPPVLFAEVAFVRSEDLIPLSQIQSHFQLWLLHKQFWFMIFIWVSDPTDRRSRALNKIIPLNNFYAMVNKWIWLWHWKGSWIGSTPNKVNCDWAPSFHRQLSPIMF